MNRFERSLLPPPGGIQHNSVNLQSQMPVVYATAALMLTVTFVSVFTRAFTKIWLARSHRTEDWLSYAAFAIFIAHVVCVIVGCQHGLTLKISNVDTTHYVDMLFWINVIYSVYSFPAGLAKLSVLFQIKSIFTSPSVRDGVYWVVVTSIVLNAAFYIGFFIACLLQCVPREKVWLGDTVEGHCIDFDKLTLFSGVANIISDIEALLLPAWALWRLSLPVKSKMAVFSVFAIALIAIGIGIVGMVLRVQFLHDPDITELYKGVLTVTCEIAVVILVGCVPTFVQLYRYMCSRHRATAGPQAPYHSGGSLVQTIGSSGKKRVYNSGAGGSTLSKYIDTQGVASMTSLGSHFREGTGEIQDDTPKHTAVTITREDTGVRGMGNFPADYSGHPPDAIWKTRTNEHGYDVRNEAL
ncbi:hypothetical protein GQ53DRAFT_723385 [Thozetella sp. PMI_491]|nr:hypothetical protein GQ53DRAFT_723385 [Thozetella sp. PMI_491]